MLHQKISGGYAVDTQQFTICFGVFEVSLLRAWKTVYRGGCLVLRGGVAKALSIPATPASPDVSLIERVIAVCPEPMVVLKDDLVVLGHNFAAGRFLGSMQLVGRQLGDFLKPSGLEFDGSKLGPTVAIIAARITSGGAVRVLVRRDDEDLERLLFLNRLDLQGAPAWAASIEGATAREDLLELRSKSRESAHALNNVVMTAVGNVSLARLYATQPAELVKHLDSAERNLLQVRDITRDLQMVAKKDIPLS